MNRRETTSKSAEDWRLCISLRGDRAAAEAEALFAQLQAERAGAGGGDRAVGAPPVLTHNEGVLFAYADDEQSLSELWGSVEAKLAGQHPGADLILSHWEQEIERWVQVKPELDAQQRAGLQFERQANEQQETRRLVASAGRFVRADIESTMQRCAQQLGLSYEVVEHPHLLTTQLAFTVSGERGKIDDFAQVLRAEGMATLRADGIFLSSAL